VGQYVRELNAATWTERTKDGDLLPAQASRALQAGGEGRFWRLASGGIDFQNEVGESRCGPKN
jgi:hypothetical protein